MYFTMRKPLAVFLLLSGFSLKNALKFKPKWPPKNQRNMMPLRTQNHPKMYRNSMILAPKHANLRPKCDFWEGFVLDGFLNIIFQLFWQHLISKWGPGQKEFSIFCVHFGSQRSFFEATAFFIDSGPKNIDKMLKFESDYLKIPWNSFQT